MRELQYRVLDSCNSENRREAGFYEKGNDPQYSIKGVEFYDQFREYLLLKTLLHGVG
jgi:hypothetical protein